MPEVDAAPAPAVAREPFRVGSRNDPKKLASAITKCIEDSKHFPQLNAVGHGAVGQAVKALAIADVYLKQGTSGVRLANSVEFGTVPDNHNEGQEISLMVFTTFDRGRE